jgi:hypothetical protein
MRGYATSSPPGPGELDCRLWRRRALRGGRRRRRRRRRGGYRVEMTRVYLKGQSSAPMRCNQSRSAQLVSGTGTPRGKDLVASDLCCCAASVLRVTVVPACVISPSNNVTRDTPTCCTCSNSPAPKRRTFLLSFAPSLALRIAGIGLDQIRSQKTKNKKQKKPLPRGRRRIRY